MLVSRLVGPGPAPAAPIPVGDDERIIATSGGLVKAAPACQPASASRGPDAGT